MTKEVLTFDPRKASETLLSALQKRARDVLERRFGLKKAETMTLEAVGQIYGITRERVRQIEDFALRAVKKSEAFAAAGPWFEELKQVVDNYGGVVHEREFLGHVASNHVIQNNAHFLLVLGDAFAKLREDGLFHRRWTTDKDLAEVVHQSLKNLSGQLSETDLLTEEEIVNTFLTHRHQNLDAERARLHAKNWLRLSKEIGQSPIGEWGLTRSPNVRVRGIRDYAFLIMRRHGSPMHFTEVAKAITETFNHPANAATSHNELIKDNRFVLVGRGLYALAEWGYTPGIVRDVIKAVLDKHGPLSREEVLEKVKKERYVKDNTILVNLKNTKHFKYDKKTGKFGAV